MDGKLMKENTALLNIDGEKINEILKKAGKIALKTVLILTVDSQGNVYIQQKFKKAQSFQVKL